eukprot:scaffold168468_cov31-Tisochrysis_lutea.AAC.5
MYLHANRRGWSERWAGHNRLGRANQASLWGEGWIVRRAVCSWQAISHARRAGMKGKRGTKRTKRAVSVGSEEVKAT